jgi:hypothetical protein
MSWQTGMKVDPVALATFGSYTETYGSSEPANIANLYASLGYFEDAPNVTINIVAIMDYYLRKYDE